MHHCDGPQARLKHPEPARWLRSERESYQHDSRLDHLDTHHNLVNPSVGSCTCVEGDSRRSGRASIKDLDVGRDQGSTIEGRCTFGPVGSSQCDCEVLRNGIDKTPCKGKLEFSMTNCSLTNNNLSKRSYSRFDDDCHNEHERHCKYRPLSTKSITYIWSHGSSNCHFSFGIKASKTYVRMKIHWWIWELAG